MVPAYREFFADGVVSVRRGDIGAFAEAIIELLDDEGQLRELSKKGRSLRIKVQLGFDSSLELKALEEA